MEKREIVLFEYDDIRLEVPVTPEQETVWQKAHRECIV